MTQCSWPWLLSLVAVAASALETGPLTRTCRKLPNFPLSGDALVRLRPLKLTLFIRRVDDPQPYYRRVRISLEVLDGSRDTLTSKLIESLSSHLNVSGIERIVQNDLLVITSDVDLFGLECDDRLEVSYRGCGPPTRAPSMVSTVDGLRNVYAASQQLPQQPACSLASQCDSGNACYQLLFTIKSGIGKSVWLAYNTATGNESMPIHRSADVTSDVGQPDLFRSDALDYLNELRLRLGWREILLVVYSESGHPALRLTFDIGRGIKPLTRHSWFSQVRLSSSWPIANIAMKTFNYFSAEGHADNRRVQRRFFINYNYGGCLNDAGVLVIADVHDPCDWVNTASSVAPMIAFRNVETGSWSRGLQRGRRMSIFVR